MRSEDLQEEDLKLGLVLLWSVGRAPRLSRCQSLVAHLRRLISGPWLQHVLWKWTHSWRRGARVTSASRNGFFLSGCELLQRAAAPSGRQLSDDFAESERRSLQVLLPQCEVTEKSSVCEELNHAVMCVTAVTARWGFNQRLVVVSRRPCFLLFRNLKPTMANGCSAESFGPWILAQTTRCVRSSL